MRRKNPAPLTWLGIFVATGIGIFAADRLMAKKIKKPLILKPGKIEPSSYPLDRYTVSIDNGQPQFSGIGNIAFVSPTRDVLISLPSEIKMSEIQIDPNVEIIAGDLEAKDFLFRFKSGKQYPILLATLFVSGFDTPLELRHA